jgi:hypothetical protein
MNQQISSKLRNYLCRKGNTPNYLISKTMLRRLFWLISSKNFYLFKRYT